MKSGVGVFYHSLTSRLLALTIIFIMVAEIFIYIPSLTQFKIDYLNQKLLASETAALSLEEVPRNMLSPELQEELLASIGVNGIIIIRADSRQLIFSSNMPNSLDQRYNVKDRMFYDHALDSLKTMFRAGEGNIQVRARSQSIRFRIIEVVLNEEPLFKAMSNYSQGFLGIGLIIAIFTAALVFISLHFIVVRPIAQIKKSIEEFRKKPEGYDNLPKNLERKDEIGSMEKGLVKMQDEVSKTLKEKKRLAELGIAVSKINHDLRNILATVQLSSDRLSSVDDPVVQSLYPRIEKALDRGIDLCQSTLKHGKANESPAKPMNISLFELINEIEHSQSLKGVNIKFINSVSPHLEVFADPDHLYRILTNLLKNAREAMHQGGEIEISVLDSDTHSKINIRDTGAGISKKVEDNLFTPFLSSTKGSGAGLGLSIAKELMEAHKGEINLEATSSDGTVFTLTFPKKT